MDESADAITKYCSHPSASLGSWLCQGLSQMPSYGHVLVQCISVCMLWTYWALIEMQPWPYHCKCTLGGVWTLVCLVHPLVPLRGILLLPSVSFSYDEDASPHFYEEDLWVGVVKNRSTWKPGTELGHSWCFWRMWEAFHGSSQMEGLGFKLYVAPTDSLCPSTS